MKNKLYETAPTGKLTYRQLAEHIAKFDDEQKDMNVTIEQDYNDEGNSECFLGELRICSSEHHCLDDFHPVIYFPVKTGDE